jgi:hypothetical protein
MRDAVDKFTDLVLACLAFVLLLAIVQSLQWRITVDTPLLAYPAFLMDKWHFVPYVDFFDINMPGTLWIFLLAGKVFQYSDLGFRVMDLFFLAGILAATWAWLRTFDPRAAFLAVVAFGLLYLSGGAYMIMQRDCMILAFTSVSLFILFSEKLRPRTRSFLVGLLFGIAATIKPHAVIGLPLVVIFETFRRKPDHVGEGPYIWRFIWSCLWTGFGLALPLVTMFGALWYTGALNGFLDVARNYWPVYLTLSGEFVEFKGPSERLGLAVKGFMTSASGRFLVLLVPAVLGSFIALFNSRLNREQRERIILLMGLAGIYAIYACITGKFFFYYMILYAYFALILASMCILSPAGSGSRGQRLFPLIVIVLTVMVAARPSPELAAWLTRTTNPAPRIETADQIASYLKEHLKPGDTVQPLDLIEGAIHGMFIARARLATPFLYTYVLGYQTTNPYVKKLQERFLIDLKAAKPRFIIQTSGLSLPQSPEEGNPFAAALQAFVRSSYDVTVKTAAYTIFERRSPP